MVRLLPNGLIDWPQTARPRSLKLQRLILSKTMPKTTKTTVNQNSEGQYQVTIPKAIGDAMGLADTKVEWSQASAEALRMEVAADE